MLRIICVVGLCCTFIIFFGLFVADRIKFGTGFEMIDIEQDFKLKIDLVSITKEDCREDSEREVCEPSMINLSDEELLSHLKIVITLISQCKEEELLEKMEMMEIRESYGRMLYKIEAIAKPMINPDKIFFEMTYYIYAFIDNNIFTEESSLRYLHIVGVWGDNRALLNSGFKKGKIDNNWLYWEENGPDIFYLEYELKKAFNSKPPEKMKKVGI